MCLPCLQVKQLGSGDVGMVDLVQLVGSEQRFALKSLEKREMLERNKVGGRLVAWRFVCCVSVAGGVVSVGHSLLSSSVPAPGRLAARTHTPKQGHLERWKLGVAHLSALLLAGFICIDWLIA